MSNNVVLAPVLIHLFAAVLQLIFWRKTVTHRVISVVSCLLGLIMSVYLFNQVFYGDILTLEAASWKAPFGIVFVADTFSASLVLLTSIVGLAVSLFSGVGVGRARMLYGYFPIFHLLVMGLNGAFLTGDIFNLYVWFEVIIISSFVLMTLGGRKAQLEGAVKYMSLNILASTFFLTGVGILYGITGTLNMADLAIKIPLVNNDAIVNMTATFFLIGFGIKSAVFPLYFWLPSSYHTPPSAVAAIFGGLLTKVGLYAMFRIFTLVFTPDDFLKMVFIGIGVMTILTGVFGSVIKTNIRRLFSYLIICHIGFIMGGLGLYSQIAFMGAIFYLFHDIIIKTNLFLISGLIRQLRGTMDMERLGGLYSDYPKISLMIALVLFSLVGIPPLSGFWPKIYLIRASMISENWWLVVGIIIGSFGTLYVIAKLWSQVFWKNASSDEIIVDSFKAMPRQRQLFFTAPILLLTITTLFIGLNAEFIISVADRIASEMINPTLYIEAVLGK